MAQNPNKGIPPELEAARRKAEQAIMAAVLAFSEETGLTPSRVECEMLDVGGRLDSRPQYLPARVRMEFSV